MKFTLETIAAPAAEQNIDALIASLENMQAAQASLEAWGYSDRWKRAFDPEGILVAMTGVEPSVEGFAEGVKNTVAKIIEWIKTMIGKIRTLFSGTDKIEKHIVETSKEVFTEQKKLPAPVASKLISTSGKLQQDIKPVVEAPIKTASAEKEYIQVDTACLLLKQIKEHIEYLTSVLADELKTFDRNKIQECRAGLGVMDPHNLEGIKFVTVGSPFDDRVGYTEANIAKIAQLNIGTAGAQLLRNLDVFTKKLDSMSDTEYDAYGQDFTKNLSYFTSTCSFVVNKYKSVLSYIDVIVKEAKKS